VGTTTLVSHTSVDCRDAFALSEWWKQVLGYVDVPGDLRVLDDRRLVPAVRAPGRASQGRRRLGASPSADSAGACAGSGPAAAGA
jgi:hypothetical protein